MSEQFETKFDELLDPSIRASLAKITPLLGVVGLGLVKRLAEHYYNRGIQENTQHIAQLQGDVAKLQSKLGGMDRLFGCELYKHHSGRIYQLICVANSGATDPDYVVTAVYKDINSGVIYSRSYEEFKEKFTLFSDMPQEAGQI